MEENRHHIPILAEGIGATNQHLERFQEKVTEEFRAVRGEMAGGFRAQEKLIKGLGARVDRWEVRSA